MTMKARASRRSVSPMKARPAKSRPVRRPTNPSKKGAPLAPCVKPIQVEISLVGISHPRTLGALSKVDVEPQGPGRNNAGSSEQTQSLLEMRGYEERDLRALAQMGYHYFRSGGLELAAAVFDGLLAIQPNEPYYHLAFGLTQDRLGHPKVAEYHYEQARTLDPTSGRASINLAELALEQKRFKRARGLLREARKRCQAHGEYELTKKIDALLEHLPGRQPRLRTR